MCLSVRVRVRVCMCVCACVYVCVYACLCGKEKENHHDGKWNYPIGEREKERERKREKEKERGREREKVRERGMHIHIIPTNWSKLVCLIIKTISGLIASATKSLSCVWMMSLAELYSSPFKMSPAFSDDWAKTKLQVFLIQLRTPLFTDS